MSTGTESPQQKRVLSESVETNPSAAAYGTLSIAKILRHPLLIERQPLWLSILLPTFASPWNGVPDGRTEVRSDARLLHDIAGGRLRDASVLRKSTLRPLLSGVKQREGMKLRDGVESGP